MKTIKRTYIRLGKRGDMPCPLFLSKIYKSDGSVTEFVAETRQELDALIQRSDGWED